MVAQISIPVSNVSVLLGLGFTHIEVWNSKDEGANYQEITSNVAKPAKITSLAASSLFRMGGKLLTVKVNGGSSQDITFSSVLDYWTPTQVANRINEVIVGFASVIDNQVILTTSTTGRTSSIEIVYSDSDDLGFVAGQIGIGFDARILLVSGTFVYTYSDVVGLADYRYKWRFSSNGSNPISEFSERVLGSDPPISSIDVSIAMATFIGLDARPIKTKVIVTNSDDVPQNISGFVIGTQLPIVVESDKFGFVQIPMVIGSKVRVAIEGTAFVRDFTVPNTGTFDLLNVMASALDPYSVQQTVPFLIRRSI